MFLLVASLALALSVSFLCSLMEAALLSLSPGQLAALAARRPKIGAIWQGFKREIEKPISVILMLNTTAHTVGATVAGAQYAVLFDSASIGVFSAVLTYVMLQFTELLPKSLGVRFNELLAPPIAIVLSVLCRLLSPVIYLFRLINRPFELRRKTDGRAGLEELAALAGLARLSNLLNPHQERIIRSAALMSTRPMHQLMVPVEQITFLSTAMKLVDAIVTAHGDPHTRFPVIRDANRDDVVGYINFKELVNRARTNPSDPTVAGIIRPVHFLAADTPSSDALRLFVNEHVHMAIVRDAAGKTLGLITLEDLIEELVGELEDEFDRLPRMIHPLSKGVWVMGGGVPMTEVAARIEMPPPAGAQVLSDWLIERAGRAPQLGQIIRCGGFDFVVRRVRRGRVFEILVTPEGKAPPELRPAAAPAAG